MHEHRPRRPLDLKWPDWKTVLLRTGRTMIDMDTSLRCAGVAFFSFLSIFPSIAIVVLLVGLLADRSFLLDQVERLSLLMPDIAFAVIVRQLDTLLGQPQAGLGVGLAISIAVALWSGSRGIDALIYAASATYYDKVRRNFFIAAASSFAITILGAAFMIVALALVAAIPIIIGLAPIPLFGEQLALFVRWPALMGLAILAFSLLYRFAIDHGTVRIRRIWPGALLASLLWLAACLLFSLYVENFGQFEASFGSLAAAVVLLFWLYISAQIFVLGAAFNAEIALQAAIHVGIGSSRSSLRQTGYGESR